MKKRIISALAQSYGLFSQSAGLRPAMARGALLDLTVGRPIAPFPRVPSRFLSQGIQLPLGQSDFRSVIDAKCDFVDKSLFIKDVMDDNVTAVSVITRPRRFGKTLNLSMLEYFLASEVRGLPTKDLFSGLKIATINDGAYMQHQGQYPVISISLKDVKDLNFEISYSKIQELIVALYDKHGYLAASKKLTSNQKQLHQLVLNRKAKYSQLQNSLLELCKSLHQHHGKKPWLLIDEYDTPIQASYQYNYYEEMILFMRNFFGAALKDNPYLERAIITGILRVSKESLFSGLNNVEVYTVLRTEYSQHFGFTEDEVDTLLTKAGLKEKAKEIKSWYNGYQFGETIIYNPWSIVNCIRQDGKLQPYWLNTSDNALVKTLFAQANEDTKIKLESLVKNEPVVAIIDENVAFTNFVQNPDALWSLLLSSGYLKATACQPEDDQLRCQLLPPNYEVSLIYNEMVKEWISERIGQGEYDSFIASLLKGNIDDFTRMLKRYLVETFSVFDVSGERSERFYHGFILGLISSTLDTHIIKSNRESGYGRYDVVVIPKDLTQPNALGLILEFKTKLEDEKLQTSAKKAIKQIDKRNYEAELRQQGITNILKIGLAFHGKEVKVVHERVGKDDNLIPPPAGGMVKV